MDEIAKNSTLRGDQFVYILGSQSFFHEALSLSLQQALGVKCIVVDNLEKIAEKGDGNERNRILLLIDGMKHEVDTTLAELQSVPRFSRPDSITALFNLQVKSSIEKWAFGKGVRGFFYQDDSLQQMLKGLHSLLRGEIWMSRNLLVDFALQAYTNKGGVIKDGALLTQREMEVLALVSAGASNEDISERLFISRHTVKTHLYNVFKKIRVPNRLQAALWAAKHL